MDVHHLRTFRSVVATGSVRGAADVLGYSPSAVSQQLAHLQRQAGVELLARVGRGVEPTAAGHALADRVDGLLGELTDLEDFVRSLKSGHRSALILTYFPSLGVTWLPRIIAPLAAEFPDTRVDLLVSDVFEPQQRPRSDLQLAVVPDGFHPGPGYDLDILAHDPYVVALPADHELASHPGEPVPMAALADQSWIDSDFSQGWCRRVTLDACAAAGFQPRFRIQTHDYQAALALVAADLGIAVMPALGVRSAPPGVVTRPIVRPEPIRMIGAVILQESRQAHVVQRALALAHSVAADA